MIYILSRDIEQVHGGIEEHAYILERLFLSHGIQVKKILNNSISNIILSNEDVLILEGIKRAVILKLLISHSKYKRGKIILFTHGSFYEFIHFKMLKSIGYKFGLNFFLKKIFDVFFIKEFFRMVNLIFTTSEEEKLELCKYYKLGNSKIAAIRLFNKMDSVESISPSKVTAQLEEKITNIGSYVLTPGRLHPRKNLLNALLSIRDVQISYIICGQDQGILKKLVKIKTKYNINNFHYFGLVSNEELYLLIKKSKVVLIPSYFEVFPAVILESLSLGVNCIVTENNYLDKSIKSIVMECKPTVSGIRNTLLNYLGSRAMKNLVDIEGQTNNEIFTMLLHNINTIK